MPQTGVGTLGQEEYVNSNTAITLSGTWFARVGTAPYELLGLIEHTGGPVSSLPPLPRMELAA